MDIGLDRIVNQSVLSFRKTNDKKRKFKSREKYYDGVKKKHIYRGDGSDTDDESTEQPMLPPNLPDLLNAIKPNKKKVFRDHNHIFFRCRVTMDNVNKLCNLIDEYNREHDAIKADMTTLLVFPPKPIYLHITSVGGDVFAGFMAYDYIKNSKIPIYTISEGHSISSGANMFMAGHKRFMTPNSYILIHQIKVTIGSMTMHDLIDEISNDIEIMSKIYGIYLNNIRHNRENVPPEDILTKEKLENHMTHDIFWNYDTCKRYGLVDGLYTNYTETDEMDVDQFFQNSSNTKKTYKPKIYSLEELKPSEQVVKKIKECVESRKKTEKLTDEIKKYLSTKLGINNTDKNDNDDDKLAEGNSNKCRKKIHLKTLRRSKRLKNT